MNYTGSTFCGPTIFAIVYSSVTTWRAFFSCMVRARSLNGIQGVEVVVVVFYLASVPPRGILQR